MFQITINYSEREISSFIEYIKYGMQLNLIIGIDFTEEYNLEYTNENSLHNQSSTYNNYEKIIDDIGSHIALYSYDKQFQVYGFGAKLNGSNDVNHYFPLNNNEE